MAGPGKSTVQLWAAILLPTFVAAAFLTLMHEFPLLRGPAADLRQAVPPSIAFFTFLFLLWVGFLLPLILLSVWWTRRGLSSGIVAMLLPAVVLAFLLVYPYVRYVCLKGRFLVADDLPQLVLIRETINERPTLVIHGGGTDDTNVLLKRIRDSTRRKRPVLFESPFYPEPDWDAFVSVELPEDSMRDVAELATWELLKRPRPMTFVENPKSARILHTCALIRGEHVYGVSVSPGGLDNIVTRLRELLPATSRDRVEPWTRSTE